jgi:hypothetical protein
MRLVTLLKQTQQLYAPKIVHTILSVAADEAGCTISCKRCGPKLLELLYIYDDAANAWQQLTWFKYAHVAFAMCSTMYAPSSSATAPHLVVVSYALIINWLPATCLRVVSLPADTVQQPAAMLA